jgi:cysteine desulfurase
MDIRMIDLERIYLDYNATAPLSPVVLEELKEGNWPMGNPSSVHASGKSARRKMGEVKDYLYSLFGLNERDKDLFFHSGATEGINTLVKSVSLQSFRKKRNFFFIFACSDHSCVVNQRDFLETLGHTCGKLHVNHQGEVDLAALETTLEGIDFATTDVLLNWTWVNNETGVVNPLEPVVALKKKYPQLSVHVDAVQSIGKIPHYRSLYNELDAYTFSAHKFGALKGIGFTFVRPHFMDKALLNGGGQQDKMRSGTENTWGVFSIAAALKDMEKNYSFDSQNKGKVWIEENLLELMGEKGSIAGYGAKERNGNTLYFILNNIKAQTVAMALDMAGMDVSNGSACSSGAVVPSRVLLGMGYSEDQAISAIRISFGPYFNEAAAKALWPKLETVLKRFL